MLSEKLSHAPIIVAIVSVKAVLATVTGIIAALFTTVAYLPQLKKCWDTGKAEDLSLKMFTLLASGIGLWVIYGILQGDIVIVAAKHQFGAAVLHLIF